LRAGHKPVGFIAPDRDRERDPVIESWEMGDNAALAELAIWHIRSIGTYCQHSTQLATTNKTVSEGKIRGGHYGKQTTSFQFYVKDWLSSESVVVMTAEQRGWYIQLLCHAWNGVPTIAWELAHGKNTSPGPTEIQADAASKIKMV
jgi:hypothetical protein